MRRYSLSNSNGVFSENYVALEFCNLPRDSPTFLGIKIDTDKLENYNQKRSINEINQKLLVV